MLSLMSNLLSEKLDPLVEKVNKIDSLVEKVNNIDSYVKSAEQRIHDLEQKADMVDSLSEIVEDQSKQITDLAREVSLLKESLSSQECHSRRDNLQFLGVKESKTEDCEAVIRDICSASAHLSLDNHSISRAHRLGAFRQGFTRPIIVKFHHFKSRMSVWEKREEITKSSSHSGLKIIEDWPMEVANKRRKLTPFLIAALKRKDSSNSSIHKAKLVVDKLVVDGVSYTVDTLDTLPSPLKPETLATKSTDKAVAFFSGASKLSNHYRCPIRVDSNGFSSVEQFLMYKKAMMFEDTAAAAKILATDDPILQKRYGRKIDGYNDEAWKERGPDILLHGLLAKFEQNTDCLGFLQQTGNKQIIEASKDKFWGCGMSLYDTDLWVESKWARNEAGKALMKVRESLK